MRPLRIATLGDYHKYYSYFTYGTMEGAIRCGAWFRPIPLFGPSLGEIWDMINFMKPHIMFCHCIFNRKPHNRDDVFEMLRKVRKTFGTKIFYHMGDARIVPRYPHDISEFVDFGLVNHGECERWSKIWNVPCYHWPYPALFQKQIAPVNPDFANPLVFTGGIGSGHHHGERTGFLDELGQWVSIKTFPDERWGNTRMMTNEVSASSDAVLGVQMGREIFLYQDVRPFQYIGAGALYFHDICENITTFFDPGVHFIGYERGNAKDVIDKYRYYVNGDGQEEAKTIREKGFRLTQIHHSTQVRVQFVIDLALGKIPRLFYLNEGGPGL